MKRKKTTTKHNTIKVILWMGAASLLWPRPSNRSSISFKRRLQQFAAPPPPGVSPSPPRLRFLLAFLSGRDSAANLSECRAYQYFISKYISARPSRCHRMKQKCSQISLTV